jgi:hypothetical protein
MMIAGGGTFPIDAFDGISNLAALSNGGLAAYAGLSGLTWQLATSAGDTVPVANHEILSPSISDDGHISIKAGSDPASPIRVYSSDLSTFHDIAVPAYGFTSLGNTPAISQDGKVVTFTGVLSQGGGALLGINPGPGVFAGVELSTGLWTVVKVAGVAGDGYLDPARRTSRATATRAGRPVTPTSGPSPASTPRCARR